MKRINLKLLFMGFLIFTLYGCPDNAYDKREISFKNSSEKSVSILLGDGKGGGYIVYPDTTLPFYDVTEIVVQPKSSRRIQKISLYSQDSIYLFVLDPDTIAKYPWEQIREDYNIIKRYGLSWKKLAEENYTVYYP